MDTSIIEHCSWSYNCIEIREMYECNQDALAFKLSYKLKAILLYKFVLMSFNVLFVAHGCTQD